MNITRRQFAGWFGALTGLAVFPVLSAPVVPEIDSERQKILDLLRARIENVEQTMASYLDELFYGDNADMIRDGDLKYIAAGDPDDSASESQWKQF